MFTLGLALAHWLFGKMFLGKHKMANMPTIERTVGEKDYIVRTNRSNKSEFIVGMDSSRLAAFKTRFPKAYVRLAGPND